MGGESPLSSTAPATGLQFEELPLLETDADGAPVGEPMADTAVVLEFATNFYSEEGLEEALAAWGNLAGFIVAPSPAGLRLTITDPDPEIEDFSDHFANHVLWATITRSRRQRAEALA